MPAAIAPLLGLGTSRLQESQDIESQARRDGEWRRGMEQLAGIARTAKDSGEHSLWIEAELAWVKLAAGEGGDVLGSWVYEHVGFASCLALDVITNGLVIPLLFLVPAPLMASRDGELVTALGEETGS